MKTAPGETSTTEKLPFTLLLVCGLFTLPAATSAQGVISRIPTLGGSTVSPTAINNAGDVVGYSQTAGDLGEHAFRFSGGTNYDLGTLGGRFSNASGVNSGGIVCGDSSLAGDAVNHAFLFSQGSMFNLGTLGGSASTAVAISDLGHVVGSSLTTGDASQHAYLFTSGSMIDLGTLGGTSSTAWSVNRVGQVAGDATTLGEAETRAFIYSGGVITDLGTLGGPYSSAARINDAGQVVGSSYTTNFELHGFLFQQGVMTDLGTLGGTYSRAMVINASGMIVGNSSTADGMLHGFIYRNGVMTDLGTLGGSYSIAASINSAGDVVGDTEDENFLQIPFLWRNGSMINLNSYLPPGSGWDLWSASFINDSGKIVGYGLYQGNFSWYLLSLPTGNHSPVANAGADVTAECSSSVVLNGSASSDQDGDLLTYAWLEGNVALGTGATLAVNFSLGSHVVTLTVSDPAGATSQDTVTVTVADTTAPTVSCPAFNPISADANGHASLPNIIGFVTASDSCSSSLTGTQSPAAGTVVGLGAHTVTVSVTDGSGNVATCTSVINVVDTTAPNVSCPALAPASADANGQAAIPNVVATVVASDNCTPAAALVKSQNPAAGSLVGPGTYSITVQVVDAAGNVGTCTSVFTVVDSTAPVVVRPDTVTVSVGQNCQAIVPDIATTLSATDNCTAANALVRSQSPAAGAVAGVGEYTITMQVADTAGNVTVCTTLLKVVDSTAPVLVDPQPLTLAAGANGKAAIPDVASTVTATDNCTPVASLSRSQSPAVGTLLGPGSYTITVQVADASGNVSITTATLSVVDTTAPAIACPEPVTLIVGANGKATVPDFASSVSASDNCTEVSALTRTQSPAAGSQLGAGDHTITVTVTDAAGNSASCTTVLTVRDTTAPVFNSATVDPVSIFKPGNKMVPVTVSVSLSDNCDAAPTCSIISITSSEPVTQKGDNTSPDWQITGPLTANLRSEIGAKNGTRVYTLTLQASDASGNHSTRTVTVTVSK